jgi:hypothetical protein
MEWRGKIPERREEEDEKGIVFYMAKCRGRTNDQNPDIFQMGKIKKE